MINIIIPTFRRLHNGPVTFTSIPEKYREQTTLVVQPQEEEEARKIAEARAAEEAELDAAASAAASARDATTAAPLTAAALVQQLPLPVVAVLLF